MGQSIFEKRRNEKALAKVNQIEAQAGQPSSTVAVQGTQKFNWSDGATIAVSVFAVIFVVALLAGYFIAPGGLLLAVGFNAVKPRRTIALSPHSVSLWKQSMWSGAVKELIGSYPRNELTLGDWTTIAGNPAVKLKQAEVNALRAAQTHFGPVAAPMASTAPPPPAPNAPLV